MNCQNKYSLKIDLTKIPSDVIPNISFYFADYSVLDDEDLEYTGSISYLLHFLIFQNMPKMQK
jgi:hypothetical protein